MEIVRGNHTKFSASFVDDSGEPLIASNPEEIPSVVIRDPSGEVYSTGVGRAIDLQGNYSFEWFAPETLEITPIDQQWTIEWFFTNAQDYTRSVQDFFRIVDSIIPTTVDNQYTYLTRHGNTERIVLTLERPALEVKVTLLYQQSSPYGGSSTVSQSLEETLETVPEPARKIGMVQQGGIYRYYYNTRPLTYGEYQVFWDVREDYASPRTTYQQVIRVPEDAYWSLNKSLLMLIDKLKKKYNTFQAYTEDQVYECLVRGVGLVNGIHPVTSWTLSSIPLREHMGVAEAVLLGASKWAFIMQQTLEEELKFDHGAQTVSLGVQHDYSGVTGMIDSLLDKFAEAKPRLVRIMCRPGLVGVRPYRLGWQHRVYRLGPSGSWGDNYTGFSALLASMNF